ncbi:MAG: DctP family TRAP transporter solute-binding subunit [Spirochaetia bacterium]|jgi:tripartite ATP-independent transporter DctP family solute receptor|nr:DctP family TRAP transporter solute-binding subunit [Spirochaetia bacterium]
MKRSQRFLVLGIALVFALLATQAFAADFKPKAEYTMQVNVGPLYDWGVGAQRWADLIKEKTGGKVNVKPYFGSSLLAGKQTNWYQAVADGAIDFAVESTINASGTIPALNLFNLPFFMPSYDAVDKIENGKAGKMVIAELEKGGLKFLAWGENGYRQITNSKKEIKSPDDMKGLKFRAVGSPIFIDMFKALGADATMMSWADAVTAFQQGVVDGQENPKSVLTVVKIWEYHKYLTNWGYVLDPLVFVVNARVWKSFPEDIQKAIAEAALEAGEYEKALARAYLDGTKSADKLKTKYGVTVEDAYAVARSKGMVITDLTPAQFKVFKDKLAPVYDAWVPKVGKAIVDAAIEDMK